MGICDTDRNANIMQANNNFQYPERPSFRCTYDVKEDNSYIQIINGRDEDNKYLTKETETKIKILNNGKIENLGLKKKI